MCVWNSGYNLTNRMPLYVQPPAKVSLQDTIAYMRNHYEASPLDMTGNEFSDVGAGYAGNYQYDYNVK